MKALVYKTFGPAEVLEWTDQWPEPTPGPGQVLVRVEAGSVNPKDIFLRKGRYRLLARDPLPRITGLDIAGRVAATGPDVTRFKPGDPVFGMSNRFCGGTHAELALFGQDEIARAPGTVSAAESAAVPLAGQTALQALRDCCNLKKDQKILINGASGGVGHFAVQIAKIVEAEVHGVCGPDSAEFVESLGADAVHRYTDRPATGVPMEFDAVFDVFGNGSWRKYARQLGKNGVYVSTVPNGRTLFAEALAKTGLSRNNRLVIVRSRTGDLETLAGWIGSGLLRPHVDAVYEVGQAADAHRHVETKHARGKVVISFQAVGARHARDEG